MSNSQDPRYVMNIATHGMRPETVATAESAAELVAVWEQWQREDANDVSYAIIDTEGDDKTVCLILPDETDPAVLHQDERLRDLIDTMYEYARHMLGHADLWEVIKRAHALVHGYELDEWGHRKP